LAGIFRAKRFRAIVAKFFFVVGRQITERVAGGSEKEKILPVVGAPIGTPKYASTNLYW